MYYFLLVMIFVEKDIIDAILEVVLKKRRFILSFIESISTN